MNELKMIKAFAEIDGIEVFPLKYFSLVGSKDIQFFTKENKWCKITPDIIRGVSAYFEYNPMTDLALNCAARDKYEVMASGISKRVC